MFVQTHRTVKDDDTFTVYRDREKNIAVTHFSAHRGGCLYLGEVSLLDQSDCRGFSFSTTQAPWTEDSGPEIAQAYWTRHSDKLS